MNRQTLSKPSWVKVKFCLRQNTVSNRGQTQKNMNRANLYQYCQRILPQHWTAYSSIISIFFYWQWKDFPSVNLPGCLLNQGKFSASTVSSGHEIHHLNTPCTEMVLTPVVHLWPAGFAWCTKENLQPGVPWHIHPLNLS